MEGAACYGSFSLVLAMNRLLTGWVEECTFMHAMEGAACYGSFRMALTMMRVVIPGVEEY